MDVSDQSRSKFGEVWTKIQFFHENRVFLDFSGNFEKKLLGSFGYSNYVVISLWYQSGVTFFKTG